jgi:hypothetical protein
MIGYRWLAALAWCGCAACASSLDTSLDGKRCDDQGACVPGYVCSPLGICERASTTAAVEADAAISDAHVPFDAASAPDSAAPDAQVATGDPNASVTIPPGSTPARDAAIPDSSVADAGSIDVADAGSVDAASKHDPVDAGAPQQPDGPTPGAGAADVPPPPPTAGQPAVPAGPSGPGGGPREPPTPGSPPPPPGMMHSCPAERTLCLNACVDLETDAEHCGGCDTSCFKHEVCENGTCAKPKP